MRHSRSHTKSGPGRYHGNCQLITDPSGKVLGVKQPQRRLPVANFGGNWRGIEYLSYREADQFTNNPLDSRSHADVMRDIKAARR